MWWFERVHEFRRVSFYVQTMTKVNESVTLWPVGHEECRIHANEAYVMRSRKMFSGKMDKKKGGRNIE